MRGYKDADKAKEYLGLNGVFFSNSYDIAGISEACDRIQQAIARKEHITIYSDYDADGVCGCSIFLKKFKELNFTNISYYVPDREGEGYGLNRDAIDKIQNRGTELLITVDCGISNIEEVSHAKSIGLDVIVTDHHNCPPDLPDCILVNPKLGCANGQENLCGAAVAMKLCQAMGGGSAFNEGMELAAIATISDMMPLYGENKHIVNKGLEIINNKPSLEIKTLIAAAAKKETIDAEDIAFKIGPIINAAGRISTAHIGVELLSGNSSDPLSDSLMMISQNEERKQIQKNVYNQALNMLTAEEIQNQRCIVLYNPDWPVGVIGIAASKLMNSFGRPVALLAESEGDVKGSLRSVDGINIFDVLYEMNGLFKSFGGHSKAAGITLNDGKFDEFKKRFQDEIRKFDSSLFDSTIYYDAMCTSNDINLNLINELSYMKPFGQDNPPVSILLKNLMVSDYKTMGSDGSHYSAVMKDETGSIKCTGFFASLPDALVRGDMACDIVIEPSENVWNGYSSVQCITQAVKSGFENGADYERYISKIHEDFTSSSIQAKLSDGKSPEYRAADFNDILSSISAGDYSTLIIIEDITSAKNLLNNLGYDVIKNLNISTKIPDNSTMGKNTLLLAPEFEKIQSKWYSDIYYISSYNHVQVYESLAKSLHHDIQMVIMNNIYKGSLITIDRLRIIYSAIRKAVNKNPMISLLDDCQSLKIKRSEMLIAINIFTETGLLKRENGEYTVNAQTEKDIQKSRAFKLFS